MRKFIIIIIVFFDVITFSSNPHKTNLEFLPYNPIAFTYGEKLKFKLSYGFIDAGYAKLEILPHEKINGRSYYQFKGVGYSSPTFDWLFKVRDKYESVVDSASLLPLYFDRDVNEGTASFKQHYKFDHTNQLVNDGKKEIAITNNMQDMVSCFFYARSQNLNDLKKGDILTFPTFVDSEVYQLKIKFLGRENLEIDAGKFKALKFCPVVQTGRIFKSNESLLVWISDDYNKIPLLAKAKIWVGSVRMELIKMNGLLHPSNYL